ncbi:hypothetical protein KC318_g18900, partial [Hortaea werneckii]
MLYEELRAAHEDIERLESGIADRILDDPKAQRARLIRDHEVASLLHRIQNQSQRALQLYAQDEA